MSILTDTAKAASLGDKQGLKDVLDFLVTEEQLGVTFVGAAIQNAPGTAIGGVPAGAAERRDPGVPARRGAQGGRR